MGIDREVEKKDWEGVVEVGRGMPNDEDPIDDPSEDFSSKNWASRRTGEVSVSLLACLSVKEGSSVENDGAADRASYREAVVAYCRGSLPLLLSGGLGARKLGGRLG